MRLLNTETLKLESFPGDRPLYAILSHTWGRDEVLFEDIQGGVWIEKWKDKAGAGKVLKAAAIAAGTGIEYVWIDTCCIDKSSSAELSESINSMFSWYMHSKLQELIAPEKIQFFDKSWSLIGERDELSERIHAVTGIPKYALPFNGPQLDQYFSVHTRMLWASRRDTSRPEDSAYSLMGLFNVNMPLLYGEGDVAAFDRLQDEIIKRTNDQSILLNRSTHGPLENYADGFRPYYSVEFERSDIVHHPPMQKTGRGLGVSLGLYPHSDGSAGYWGIVEAYYGDDRTRLHRPALALVQKGGRVYGRESHLIYRVRPSNEGQMEVFSDLEHRRVDILQHGTGRREFIHLDYHRDEDPRDYRPLGPRLVLRSIVHKSALCRYEYTVLCPEPHGNFLVLAPPPSFYSISRGFLGAYTILRNTGAGPASPDLALLVLHLPGSFEDIFPYLVDLQSWPEGEEAGTDVYDYRGAENRLLSLPIVTKHYENPDLDAVLSCISQLWKEYIRNGRASIVLSNGVRVDAWVKEKMFLEDKLYHLRVEVDQASSAVSEDEGEESRSHKYYGPGGIHYVAWVKRQFDEETRDEN